MRTRLRRLAVTARLAAILGGEKLLLKLRPVINLALTALLRHRVIPNSVLHISYMVHIPYYTVQHLRGQGMTADYLAIGTSPYWSRCDYNYIPDTRPLRRVLHEFVTFWRVIARYQVVHAHFMYTLSVDGWELPALKRMGRKLVVHFRGCEARDRDYNMVLHPRRNICQECDHKPPICQTASARNRQRLARQFSDAILVTTPDMRDFVPEAMHFPFFAPEIDAPLVREKSRCDTDLTIAHVTNQPGIEGTREIERIIDGLRTRGRGVRLHWLHHLTHDQVLAELANADVAIGKMKMGYYANAQIESMAMGIPTITFVREEFMTEELRQSGFILTTLDTLEATIEHYLDHPEALEAKRRIARQSILHLHDNVRLARQLVRLYRDLVESSPTVAARREVTA